jgi:uncharacterized membrane protein YgcG
VPVGEAFTAGQRLDITRALNQAREQAGLRVAVFVGELPGDAHHHARTLHAALDDSADAVLIAVDPGQRLLEIVTGPSVARRVDDRTCTLAAMAMTSSLQGGNLSGGIIDGVRVLAEHAGGPTAAPAAHAGPTAADPPPRALP